MISWKQIHVATLVVSLAATVAFSQSNEGSVETNGMRVSTSAGTLDATDYAVGPHDVIEISVFELEQLNSTKRVSGEGSISLHLLGKVVIGGMTPHQVEDHLEQLLREKGLVRNPQVSVFVKEYRSRRVTIHGAVRNTGAYPLLGPRTLLDIIGEAGGLTDRASRRLIVLRPVGTDQQRIEVDIEALVYRGDPRLNIPLQPGDIVMVPHQQMMRIYVNGEVQNAGMHEFPRDEVVTVSQAVTTAGGVTERGSESRVTIQRSLQNGLEQILEVNLKRIRRGKDQDVRLEPNDIIYVSKSIF